MANCASVCASTTVHAGDSIIFRGGDTWHFGNGSASPYAGGQTWNFTATGSSGSPIYLGVDQTWYSGSSWARPVLNGDNPLFNGTSFPSSCTYNFGSNSIWQSSNYVTFDNFEITGICTNYSGSGNPGALSPGSYNTVSNVYYHGWTITASSNNLYGAGTYSGSGTQITWTHDIFDGSDAPHWSAGNANCSYDTTMPCTTGAGIYDRAYILDHCVFRYLANMAVTVDTVSAHDNLFEYLEWPPSTAAVNAQHPDALMVVESGTTVNFYNNVARHVYVTQMFYFNVSSGSTLYIFNNVFYDNLRYDTTGDTAPDNCINLAAHTSGSNEIIYLYNNTFDQDTDDSTGGGCQISLYGTSGGNSEGYDWGGPIYAANNHLIGSSNLASIFNSRGSGVSYTLNDNGGNLPQATATARSQGYVQSTSPVGDGPTSGSGSTVGTGTNATSNCATFSSDSALCSGTSGGPSVLSGIMTFPAVQIVNRPPTGAWDAGAFDFGSGSVSGTPAAPMGLTATLQ